MPFREDEFGRPVVEQHIFDDEINSLLELFVTPRPAQYVLNVFFSEADHKIQDDLHSNRKGISDNDITYAALSVKNGSSASTNTKTIQSKHQEALLYFTVYLANRSA